jgi:hypothetical protein
MRTSQPLESVRSDGTARWAAAADGIASTARAVVIAAARGMSGPP